MSVRLLWYNYFFLWFPRILSFFGYSLIFVGLICFSPLPPRSNGFSEDPQKYLGSFLVETDAGANKRLRDRDDDHFAPIVCQVFFLEQWFEVAHWEKKW